ncbi:MAG: hypothetical protein A3F16_03090 [Deltaproteobacteria bacterium RIFCSPHIGHO2_12_FULL_43_9]|nr:MAG: hypothetical protein A3F16_03090 [Deltaproteobacteria bacterium RIFCSPHIGHO2_12_FULL_43_9]
MGSKDYFIYHVKIHKKDLYKLTFLVDAYDGMASYTTLAFNPHDWSRTVELVVAKGWERDLEQFLENISHEIFPIESKIMFSSVA